LLYWKLNVLIIMNKLFGHLFVIKLTILFKIDRRGLKSRIFFLFMEMCYWLKMVLYSETSSMFYETFLIVIKLWFYAFQFKSTLRITFLDPSLGRIRNLQAFCWLILHLITCILHWMSILVPCHHTYHDLS